MNRVLIAACLTLPLSACEIGCKPLSESVADPAAGLNGGFEVTRDGLPAGWNVYTSATVPDADFALALDDAAAREGRHALRFDVVACSDTGGWHSPGLSTEVAVEPGATYTVSFQVRSEGARWAAEWGGVTAKTGELERAESAAADVGAWKRVEARCTVPANCERLRFQFNVLAPGRLWLDDVRIERAGA